MATIQGAPVVGFLKADCVLTKLRGTPRIAFLNSAGSTETELYEYAYLYSEQNEAGEYPRWVKLRGIKASPNARTVNVVITQSVETATTFSSSNDMFRVQSRYPSLYVDVKSTGWGVHISEDKTYTFALPAMATTAKAKCDTPWLSTLISGSTNARGEATLTSRIKSYEVTTP